MATREERLADLAQTRAQFKQAVVESESTGRIKVERERGRQRRSVERTRSRERILERQASEAARQSTVERRVRLRQNETTQRAIQKLQTQRDLARINRQERFKNQVASGATDAVMAAPGTSVAKTFGLLFGLFFVIIVIYVSVVNGQALGGFLGTAGTFIHGLSSNSPLFVSTQKQG